MSRSGAESTGAVSVVLVTGSLMSGGAERVMSDMANYWDRRGWRITLVTWSGRKVTDFYQLRPGIERVWIETESASQSIVGQIRSNVVSIRRFRQLLRESKPTAVLSFIDTSNVRAIVAAMGLNIRVIVSVRTNPRHSIGIPWQWRILRRRLYRYANTVTAQTVDAGRWLENECKIAIRVIANPLRRLPSIVGDRERLVLAVGRLSGEKGFDILLRAFSATRSEHADWRVVIIGSGPDKTKLQSLCEHLGVADSVEFREPVANVESWMSRAGLVVQPSRFEGFPNVILEAMGMGAAVISADCHSGPGEIIQDRINGRLVPVEDVQVLAHVMGELMSKPAARASLGLEATKIREIYGQQRIMAQWDECVLNGRSALLSSSNDD